MSTEKQKRRKGAKDRLEAQLLSGVKRTKEGDVALSESDVKRIKAEIASLSDYLSGKKKTSKTVNQTDPKDNKPKEKWFIDIYAINLGTTRHSDRRKNKGKSRKKLRKTRSTTWVKTVTLQPGLVQAYREGRMGISPRSHSFRLRKEEPSYL